MMLCSVRMIPEFRGLSRVWVFLWTADSSDLCIFLWEEDSHKSHPDQPRVVDMWNLAVKYLGPAPCPMSAAHEGGAVWTPDERTGRSHGCGWDTGLPRHYVLPTRCSHLSQTLRWPERPKKDKQGQEDNTTIFAWLLASITLQLLTRLTLALDTGISISARVTGGLLLSWPKLKDMERTQSEHCLKHRVLQRPFTSLDERKASSHPPFSCSFLSW